MMRYSLRRSGALGDVILATAVLRRLRRENPEAQISIQTAYPGVFAHNPHVYRGNDQSGALIDLDMAYEKRPRMHIVEAYMMEAFGDPGDEADWTPELFPQSGNVTLPRNAIAVHAAVAGWANRSLPRSTWMGVVRLLQCAGYMPILVGTDRDRLPDAKCSSFHTPDLMAQAGLIGACAGFVGSDTSLLHVASAMGTPSVGAFTCADPYLRLPRPFGSHAVGIVPNLDCVGCLHRRAPPVTTEFCERGDVACVGLISAAALVDALKILVPFKQEKAQD